MSVFANRVAELSVAMPGRAFLAVRRAWLVLVAAALLGGLTAWLGALEASVPTATEAGTTSIPLWRVLVMGAAVLPVLALYSRLEDLEVVATRRLRRSQRVYLCAMNLACAVIYLGGSAITLHPLVLIMMGRSWLAWCGLAMVAGVVLGWRLAWALPAAASVVLEYWGFRGGGEYEWWQFSARPYNDLPSLVLGVILLAAGLAMYWATPWRRRWWVRGVLTRLGRRKVGGYGGAARTRGGASGRPGTRPVAGRRPGEHGTGAGS